MTKTQAKKILRDLFNNGVLGKLDNAICEAIEEMENVISDMEETRDSIEAYEGRDDLTEQQQERYDWFDEVISDLEELKDYLDTWQGDLGDCQERLEERD